MYLCRNQRKSCEGVGGIESIAPLIPTFDTDWRWVVIFTLRPLYHCGKSYQYLSKFMLGWPWIRPGVFGDQISPQLVPGFEPRIFRCPTPQVSQYCVWGAGWSRGIATALWIVSNWCVFYRSFVIVSMCDIELCRWLDILESEVDAWVVCTKEKASYNHFSFEDRCLRYAVRRH